MCILSDIQAVLYAACIQGVCCLWQDCLYHLLRGPSLGGRVSSLCSDLYIQILLIHLRQCYNGSGIVITLLMLVTQKNVPEKRVHQTILRQSRTELVVQRVRDAS